MSIIGRFEELIDRGKNLPSYRDTDYSEWFAEFHKWELSCLNILEKTFGKESDHYVSFKNSRKMYQHLWIINGIACVESAKEEVEKGFLYKIEHLVSADLFDSVLEHAEHLLSKGHKDPAAILGRVVIEKTLKQMAERETIVLPDKVKLSKVNEILWKNQVYDKITWRLIHGYVDLGNFAAHGNFDKYDNDKVEGMLSWIRRNLMTL
jgi:hypothetical protein